MGGENTECLTRRLKESPAPKSCQRVRDDSGGDWKQDTRPERNRTSGGILATSSGKSVLCKSSQRKPMIVPLQTSPNISKEAAGQGHTGQRCDSLL